MVPDLIEAYLEVQLINKGKDIIKKYGKLIRVETLKTIHAKLSYLNNLKMDLSVEEQLAAVQTHQMETYLKFSHYNKSQFGLQEDVCLSLCVKNI